MNNKGQSLVVFVFLIPVIFLIIGFIFELGDYTYQKNKYENEIKYTLQYGLKHFEDENLNEKLTKLLDKNLEGNKEINISDSEIKVHVLYKPKGIYSNLFKNKFEINLTYVANKDTNKIIKE